MPTQRTLSVFLRLSSVALALICVNTLVWNSGAAYGSDAYHHVRYDTALTAPCHEVSRTASLKVMEVHFKPSVKIDSSDVARRLAVTFNIESPGQLLRTYDFLPKTNTVTDKGEISVTQSSQASVGAKLVLGEASGKAGIEVVRSWAELPDRRVQVASGTLNNEHGVFFKLNSTNQQSAEGQHTFVWFFEAPAEWRCDYIELECNSRASVINNVYDVDNHFYIGLYDENDNTAKRATEEAAAIKMQVLSIRKASAEVTEGLAYNLFGVGSRRLQDLSSQEEAAEKQYQTAVQALRGFRAER